MSLACISLLEAFANQCSEPLWVDWSSWNRCSCRCCRCCLLIWLHSTPEVNGAVNASVTEQSPLAFRESVPFLHEAVSARWRSVSGHSRPSACKVASASSAMWQVLWPSPGPPGPQLLSSLAPRLPALSEACPLPRSLLAPTYLLFSEL